jgi:hypothetical protein
LRRARFLQAKIHAPIKINSEEIHFNCHFTFDFGSLNVCPDGLGDRVGVASDKSARHPGLGDSRIGLDRTSLKFKIFSNLNSFLTHIGEFWRK